VSIFIVESSIGYPGPVISNIQRAAKPGFDRSSPACAGTTEGWQRWQKDCPVGHRGGIDTKQLFVLVSAIDASRPFRQMSASTRPAAPRPARPAVVASRRPVAPTRTDTRVPQVLDAAARLFGEKGFGYTSMRDIAGVAGMLAGSLYYHFTSKEELLVAVYAEGVRRITEAVTPMLTSDHDPWVRLENVCAAHLKALLADSGYAQVVIRVRPDDAPLVAEQLIALRDKYERTFTQAIRALSLPAGTDRGVLKLMLLGALNWSQTWYRPGGDSPQVLARRFVRLLRDPLAT
jgi:AcrR family transcriptional regulator